MEVEPTLVLYMRTFPGPWRELGGIREVMSGLQQPTALVETSLTLTLGPLSTILLPAVHSRT